MNRSETRESKWGKAFRIAIATLQIIGGLFGLFLDSSIWVQGLSLLAFASSVMLLTRHRLGYFGSMFIQALQVPMLVFGSKFTWVLGLGFAWYLRFDSVGVSSEMQMGLLYGYQPIEINLIGINLVALFALMFLLNQSSSSTSAIGDENGREEAPLPVAPGRLNVQTIAFGAALCTIGISAIVQYLNLNVHNAIGTYSSEHSLAENYPIYVIPADADRLVSNDLFQRFANDWWANSAPLTTCACFESLDHPQFIAFPQMNGDSWDCPAGWVAFCRIDVPAHTGMDDTEPLDIVGEASGVGGDWVFTIKRFEQLGTIVERGVFDNRVYLFQGEIGPNGEGIPYGPYLDFYIAPPKE